MKNTKLKKQNNPNPTNPTKSTQTKKQFNLIVVSPQIKILAAKASVEVSKSSELMFGTQLSKAGYSALESSHKKNNQFFHGFKAVFNAHPEFANAKFIDFYGFCMFVDNEIDIKNFNKKFSSMVRKGGNGLSSYLSVLGKGQDSSASQSFTFFITAAAENQQHFFVRDVETGKPILLTGSLFTGSSKSTPAERSAVKKSLAEYQKIQQLTNSYKLVINNQSNVPTRSVADLEKVNKLSINSIVHQELPA